MVVLGIGGVYSRGKAGWCSPVYGLQSGMDCCRYNNNKLPSVLLFPTVSTVFQIEESTNFLAEVNWLLVLHIAIEPFAVTLGQAAVKSLGLRLPTTTKSNKNNIIYSFNNIRKPISQGTMRSLERLET